MLNHVELIVIVAVGIPWQIVFELVIGQIVDELDTETFVRRHMYSLRGRLLSNKCVQNSRKIGQIFELRREYQAKFLWGVL